MEDKLHKTSTVTHHTDHTVRIYFDLDTPVDEIWGQRKALNNLVMSMSCFIYFFYRECWGPGDKNANENVYELRIVNLSELHVLILRDLNYEVIGQHIMSTAQRKNCGYARLQYKHL